MEATVRDSPATVSENNSRSRGPNDGTNHAQGTRFSQTTGYAPILTRSAPLLDVKPQVHLRRCFWRSSLTITCPLMVLAFYTFICAHFLAHPLSNNTFRSTTIDATWVYFCWFLISVFILEWARNGLAYIEASALKIPQLAPSQAKELTWHTKTKWANPFRWLKALLSVLSRLITRRRSRSQNPVPMPSGLWMSLSSVHLLLFMAIPLSGLSMEVIDGFAYATGPARVYGPDAGSFNSRSWVDFPQRTRSNWASGRLTAPPHGALLYAPHGSKNVSTTYFDDQAMDAARNDEGTVIRVFAGPAVRESVWGEAWGLSANISCMPTPLDHLEMIRNDAYNSSVNICSTKEGCEFQWLNTDEVNRMNAARLRGLDERILDIPVWLNESREIHLQRGLQSYSLLAAADGWSMISTERSEKATTSPYNNVSNHDDSTFDHIVRGARPEDVTNSMFEVLLWQAGASGKGIVDDEIFKDYRLHPSPLATVKNGTTNLFNSGNAINSGVFLGFGVHCDIKSAVGTATLDPDQRTFFNFTRGKAAPSNVTFLFPFNIAPVQIQAMASLAGNQYSGNVDLALTPREDSDTDSTLTAIHKAIGSTMLRRADDQPGIVLYYPTLSTENVTLAMYKLLGESVISLMGEGGVNPRSSTSLYALEPSKYLRPGTVPWQLVLALLALWAFSTSLGALLVVICKPTKGTRP